VSTPQRLQLARELHDGVAQDLVALGYELDLLLATVDLQSPTRKGIRSLRFRVDELISKVRREMYQLREANDESVQERSVRRQERYVVIANSDSSSPILRSNQI
jgi:two-component system, NarL family, sensor histidine kinase LiaS